MTTPVLQLTDIAKTYVQGERRVEVLRGVSLSLQPGEIVGLMGQSGAGKSTLLHIAGLLDVPSSGHVLIDGRDCTGLSDAARTGLRLSRLGFVYQFHHLLPEFTAEENVALPQRMAGVGGDAASARARDLLGRVGLAERLDHRPAELSGGEQQRVAIVRGLANGPAILLADEPTGNLDEATADRVMDQLLATVRDEGLAALIATHNPGLAARMDRQLTLRDGQLVDN